MARDRASPVSLCGLAVGLALACVGVPVGADRVSERACFQPGHTNYPFCNTAMSTVDRVTDFVGRIRDEDKPKLLTARGWPQGKVADLPYLGVPAHDWGLNCIHGVQSTCGSHACPTSFPNPNAMGATWNDTLMHDVAAVMGVEVRALYLESATEPSPWSGKAPIGLDCWSPNININRDPRWGRNQEVPSEDPTVNAAWGVGYTRGLQEGVDKRYLQAIVTLKHWDAYSLEDSDGFTRHNFNAVVTPHDLTDTYLPAFKASVMEGNAKGVMCSYNALNGVPTCASSFLRGTLRTAWGFEGYVTSDTGAIDDIYKQHHYTDSYVDTCCKAIKEGGCDMNSGSVYFNNLLNMTAMSKECGMTDVDAALTHTYTLLFEAGLFDPIEDQPYWHVPPTAVGTAESQALNLLAAQESLVLLRNHDGAGKPVLPFASKGKTVAVIGPHGNASAAMVGNYLGVICPSGFNKFDCVATPLQAIEALVKSAGGSVTYAQGCGVTDPSKAGFAAAVAAAKAADYVVIGAGTDQSIESESHDRTSIDLPGVQHQLIAAVAAVGKPTAVFLLNGGMVGLEPEKADTTSKLAVLEAYFPGFQGGHAIASALFGDYNPGGKLAATYYPVDYVNAVKMSNMNMTSGGASDSPGRSYRYYTGTPTYKFGYGLSYTAFRLSTPAPLPRVVELPTEAQAAAAPTYTITFTFNVTVRNVGPREGDEVVQAYLVPRSLPTLPGVVGVLRRQLFAFKRVRVASGGAAQVAFTASASTFRMVDPGTGDTISAPGDFDVEITNGVDQLITGRVALKGAHAVVETFPAGL